MDFKILASALIVASGIISDPTSEEENIFFTWQGAMCRAVQSDLPWEPLSSTAMVDDALTCPQALIENVIGSFHSFVENTPQWDGQGTEENPGLCGLY